MIQNWQIRSRSHTCAVTTRAFEEGEAFYTAIYFDQETGGYVRRDVAVDAWQQELSERQPIAYWRTVYTPQVVEEKPDVTSKESAMSLLQRFTEEDERHTEHARYILALMLERKRILTPTATRETENGKMLFYENKKTGEVFFVKDPELRLDELAEVQEEVAMLLGFATQAPGKTEGDKAKEAKPGAAAEAKPTEPEPETTDGARPAETEPAPEGEARASQDPAAGMEPVSVPPAGDEQSPH